MYKCDKCNKEYENRHAYLGHCSSHNRGAEYKQSRETEKSKRRNDPNKQHTCKYCNKEFKKGQSLGAHMYLCRSRPEYQQRIEQVSKIVKARSKELTQKIGLALSETIKRKKKEGTWKPNLKRIAIDYKGIELYGTWELGYAKWLDQNEIEWDRPNRSFEYYYKGRRHYYTPDFFLIDRDLYIEIKGYETERDRAKYQALQSPFELKVLSKKELMKLEIIDSKGKLRI